MKTLKGFVGVMLAMAMVLVMAVTSFAAEKGTITVSNPVEGQTYTAYKIFDVTYNDVKTTFAYTIDESSEWYTTVSGYTSGLTFTKIGETKKYKVEETDKFSAAEFAKLLKAAVEGKSGKDFTTDGTTEVAEDLELGYYFVTSTNGTLCNLTTTKPDVTIFDKNDRTFTKTEDKSTVNIGDTVKYEIKGKVPSTKGFSEYEYKITDTMSAGLTFNKDIKVTVDGTDITGRCTVITEGIAADFEITIPVVDMQGDIGKEISVTYTADVNVNAVSVISKNKAVLSYSNDPTTGEKSTIEVETKVYSAKIIINKFEKDNTGKKLENAKFVLKNEEGKYYKYVAGDTKVTWEDSKEAATELVTDSNGAAEFIGLADGKYSLEETAAPKGYNMLTEDVKITINGAGATDTDLSSLKLTADVANSTGAVLPETGGMGTTMFYVIGGVLVIGAAVLLVTKRRMKTLK